MAYPTWLAGNLRAYFQKGLAPYRHHVRTRFDTEPAAHARPPAYGDPGGLLGALHPELRWQSPVLTIGGLRVERDVHLRGRGVLCSRHSSAGGNRRCSRTPVCPRSSSIP
ncbi:hypothetical protein [Streptomyces sp. NRRL S-646]|uniref:hypothetical protein n=1 Tax=Streptomyces sp. NRRL S-646 TaxID=1463917 RepID=UPI0013317812|nr:hypothetical protein [Streptomyces sp. NRRL S-646]